MADPSRSERATPKRLREARERGELPRSRELTTAVLMMAAVMALSSGGRRIAEHALDWFKAALSIDPAILDNPLDLPGYFAKLAVGGFWLLLPLFAVMTLAALIAPMLLSGWNFSAKAVKVDFGRVNPISGFGRVFSGQAVMELFKGMLKAGLLGTLAGVFIWKHREELLSLAAFDPIAGVGAGLSLFSGLLSWLCGGLLLIAAIDAPYQWISHGKRLRMTKQEVRDEYKQAEGNPEMKGRIRRLQQERSRQRMIAAVPSADVVIVNPQHYAVALKYDQAKMRAPRVVAKGVDEVAAAIREVARANRVPLVEAPPLARALFRSAAIDQEIPVALYTAVAQVLTYVYQLRTYAQASGTRTAAPQLGELGDVPNGQPDPANEPQ